MPKVLQDVTLVNPLRYAIDIVQRVYLDGAGLRLLLPALWPLAAIAAVTLAAAAWMFRHRLTLRRAGVCQAVLSRYPTPGSVTR